MYRQERLRRTVLMIQAAVLALALAAVGWAAARSVSSALQQGLADARYTASLAARDIALAIAREQGRLATRLAREQARIEAAAGTGDLAPLLPALESRLRSALPGLLSLRLDSAPSQVAAAVQTRLRIVAGEPVIEYRPATTPVDQPDAPTVGQLVAEVRCAGCRSWVSGAHEDSVYLRHDRQDWHLAGPALLLGDRAPLAKAMIPEQEGWTIEVYGPPSTVFAAAPGALTLAALLTALILAAAYGTRYWYSRYGIDEFRTQERLRAYRRQLDALLESSSDGILLITPSGSIELFSPAAEMMFGHRSDDIVGQDISVLLPNLLDPQTLAIPSPTSEQPLLLSREIDGQRENGNRFPARISIKRVNLDAGLRLLLVVQDLTEAAEQAKKLRFLEQRDVATGLLNRKEFERRMQRILAEAAGGSAPYALCYIDIDQFKVVNDTAGHVAGDALIEQLATLIRVKLNAALLLARLGGDEFGALVADCDEARALDLCNNLMESVRHFSFSWRHQSFDVAISIGVTAFLPEHDSAPAELARADVACHMAKREGRNRIHVYRDSDASLIRHHGDMHLVSTISRALSSGRFRLYAQPIMPLSAGGQGRTHYEILVRMIDERGKPIEPERFIPAAEQYILMPAVDRWVIRQLFALQGEQLRAWHREHPGEFLYAINLSGTSINDEHFLPYLKREFEIRQVPPSTICFEITETAAMRSLGDARSMMQQLAALGCTFALDDFGSGLSSYGYLRELPVKYVKIDGSFVRDMSSNPVNYAVVSSINQIAHVMDMKTIAEWAEDNATINQLRALNVDFVQGYAIGTPLPVAAGEAEGSVHAPEQQVGHG